MSLSKMIRLNSIISVLLIKNSSTVVIDGCIDLSLNKAVFECRVLIKTVMHLGGRRWKLY